VILVVEDYLRGTVEADLVDGVTLAGDVNVGDGLIGIVF
jgi:hypothetical protein